MKIIALFPVKNDAWILDTVLPQLQLFSDEILCMDGGSTDGTQEKLRAHGVLIRDQDQSNVNYSSWRQELLTWGRERGGTHFVWLDADEAFTTQFLKNFRDTLSKMKPGQKLAMQWLCLWKNAKCYREDTSVWSNLYKDFVYCDDGVSAFGNTKLHEGRTPGENNETTWIRIPKDDGAVLHFQFAAFNRFQIKQVFQRCREHVLGTASPRRLNYKYSETLDDPNAKTVPIPKEWLVGITGLDSIEDSDSSWYHTEILKYFESKGIAFFEPLQIWHIKKYRDMFIDTIGRKPRSKTYPSWVVTINKIKNSLTKK